jgi:hypothetical protein
MRGLWGGIRVNHNQSNAAQSSPATLSKARKSTAKHKRRYVRTMCFGILFTAVGIGAVAGLASLIRTAPSQVANNSASGEAASAIGTITLHPDGKGCQSKTFDNRTGQISEVSGPCQNETPLDAEGVPIPMGTVHTMNSISKSFR